MTVLLIVTERALRCVDGQLDEIRATEPLQLRIEIREVAALQQRIVAEVDAGHDVVRAECDLLRLGEDVLHVAIEHEPADAPHRHEVLGDQLRRIEHVERQTRSRIAVEQLQAELPLGEISGLDRHPRDPGDENRDLRR